MARLQKAEAILLRTLGHLDPLSLRVRTLVAKYHRDAGKAQRILDDYKLAGAPLDPLGKLELENLVKSSR